MVRRSTTIRIGVLLCLLAGFAAAGCGGDANTSVDFPGGPGPGGSEVRGAVLMPNGRVAAADTSPLQRLAALVIREVRALTGDVEPVGRNVRVSLNFLRNDGVIEADKGVAFTDDAGGYKDLFIPDGFTVDGPGGRFYVAVGDGTTLTRAFVCTSVEATDIYFNSEAAFRLILEEVNTNPLVRLEDYSAAEICEIEQAIVELEGFVPGNNAFEVNENATEIAGSDPRIINLIQTAGGAPPTPTSGTPVPTNTPTNTAPIPTDTPTNTPVEPTATPTEPGAGTPTATDTPIPPGVHVNVGSGGENASNQIVIDVTLSSDENAVGGMQNDIIFDNTIVDLPGATSCRINPAIGLFPGGSSCLDDASIGPCKNLSSVISQCGGDPQPQGCPPGAGTNLTLFRGIMAATAAPNDNEIPDGVLYTCTFDVVDAGGLPTVLANMNIVVSDPLGERVEPVDGTNGLATIGAAATEPAGAGSTSITVDNAASFPATGFLLVDNQLIGYSKSGNTLNLDDPLNKSVDIGEVVLLAIEQETPTPTPTTPSDTPTETPTTMVETPTATNTPTDTPPTPTDTPTNTPPTPTDTPTNTPPTPVATDTPTNTLPIPTDTPTNTPPTPTDTPTNTPPTPTDTPTNTPPITPAEGPAINIGTIAGAAGSSVTVPVTLSNGDGNLVAVSTDIIYNSTQVQVGIIDEAPDCWINPAIGAGTPADKELLLSVLPGSGDNEMLRVGVIGLENANVLPEGALFTCNFDIDGGGAVGPKTLINMPMASDADGASVSIGGTNGIIDVVNGGPSINVGSTAGSAGSVVAVPVTLANGGGGLATASTDITFDGSQLSVVMAEGLPDCWINPAIGEGTATDKTLLLSVLDAGGGEQTLRVGVIGLNANPLPDGTLFTCSLEINAAASLGAKALSNTPDGSDADGTRVIVGGASGSVTAL